MKVAIVRPSEASAVQVDLCIVIDVLRATTTAAVLCHRLGELLLIRTPQDLVHLPPRSGGYALFSELSGVDSEIPRFDNSPVQARDAVLDGRTPVLVTTNGTRAVGLAVQQAGEVLLAGFVNLSAVIDYVRARGVATVALMPAGNIKRALPCAEDDGCAQVIADLLTDGGGNPAAVPTVIANCRVNDRILERRANEKNLAADIDLCFDADAVPVVPRVIGVADQLWFGVVPGSRL
jgi:phosphosulfolactate phosphohydrolase-like enzyme